MFRSPPQPMWDLTIHSSLGSSVLAGTRSLLQSMWDPPIHPLLEPNVLVGTPLRVHPLQAQPLSFSSPTDVGSHNPPPLEPNVLASTRSLLQSMWDSPIHPPSGPNVLAGTPLCVHSFPGSASLLAHLPISGSDTICNNPSSPLAILSTLSFL